MAGTTHRATQENGPSVVNGNLVWTSASGITTADPQSYGGCLRRWWYEKVGGKEAPATAAMRGGTALHSEIEDHLRTGARLTSPLALSGRMFIPHPGDNLIVEKPIQFSTQVYGSGSPIPVQIFGHVDLYNLRQQYIDEQGDLQADPAWSFEVKDWKTTSDFQYAKSVAELAKNIQLTTYAEAGFRLWPDLEHSRFTHVYFRTRGRPASKLVTVRRSREEVMIRWDYAESVVRTMADVARETTPERVPANTKSCNAYRGCPHASYCTEYGRTSLDALYSKIASDWNTAPNPGVDAGTTTFSGANETMGILANNPQIMQNAAPAPQQPDMRAALAAEEAQLRAQVVAQQQQPTTDQLVAALQRIQAHNRGWPAIGGNAAQPYASAWLKAVHPVQPGAVFAGQGDLGRITLVEVAHIFQLADELDAQRTAPPITQAPQPQVQTQAPPQAQPATAPYSAQVMTTAGPAQPITTQPMMQGVAFLPPDAPQSMPQLAAQQPAPPPGAQTPPEQQAATTTRGRPRKNKPADSTTAPEATAAVAAPTSPSPGQGVPASQVPPAAAVTYSPAPAAASAPTIILINARVSGQASKSLADYVDYINAELAKRYCVNDDGSPGVQDVRCAPKNSPLAFGGWKGAVREVVKSGAGLDGLEGTVLHLDTFLDELSEAVADALRVVADKRGWIYVRGVR